MQLALVSVATIGIASLPTNASLSPQVALPRQSCPCGVRHLTSGYQRCGWLSWTKGNCASLAAIRQPALLVFGDHRQTPGALSKGRAAAANRQKLLQRPLGLRALNQAGDYLPPARRCGLVARLWPDAC